MPAYPFSTDLPSPVPLPDTWTTSPVIDCEPAPQAMASRSCPTPSATALHRHTPRSRNAALPPSPEPAPPRAAVVFAEAALRRVIEVMDRRRPIAQLRPVMTPFLIDCVVARSCPPRTGSATLRRVRVRSVGSGDAEVTAAEVFASFSRGARVHAIAGRIERHRDSWRLVALQIG